MKRWLPLCVLLSLVFSQMSFSEDEIILKIGDTQKLEAIVQGEYPPSELQVQWLSSNPKVIQVDEGKVKALDLGEAWISATLHDGTSDRVHYRVERTLKGLEVPLDPLVVAVGETKPLGVDWIPLVEGTALCREVHYQVLGDLIRVDDEGKVTGLRSGETSVTVTSAEGLPSVSRKVIVPSTVRKIDFTQGFVRLFLGEKWTPEIIFDTDRSGNRSVEFSLSNDRVLERSSYKVFYAKSPGLVKVIARSLDGHRSAETIVEVKSPLERLEVRPSRIELTKTVPSVPLGVTPHWVEEAKPDQPVTWVYSSSDPRIVSVDNSGRLTGHRPGQVTITIQSDNGALIKTVQALSKIGSHETVDLRPREQGPASVSLGDLPKVLYHGGRYPLKLEVEPFDLSLDRLSFRINGERTDEVILDGDTYVFVPKRLGGGQLEVLLDGKYADAVFFNVKSTLAGIQISAPHREGRVWVKRSL